ncbi:MAG: YIP1 family protein [Bacilli bacterium]|nr:YIP1 family protein [Bacilli bacterium]
MSKVYGFFYKLGAFIEKAAKKVASTAKVLWKKFVENFIKMPLRIMSHPIVGYTEFKEDKKGKLSVAIGMVLIYALLTIIRYNADGIVINAKDPTKFNSIQLLIYTVVPLIILSVANWSITTLMNGKGNMKQIITMGGYSYFPLIVFGIINVILSNFVTVDEAQIITLLSVLSFVLMGYMIFMGLVVIHEYGVAKAILTIILTILATAVILFIALLIFDLSSQIYGFLYSLYKEIVSRFF